MMRVSEKFKTRRFSYARIVSGEFPDSHTGADWSMNIKHLVESLQLVAGDAMILPAEWKTIEKKYWWRWRRSGLLIDD